MTTRDRITEAEAVALAGVSARTLSRFQESGYLEVAITSNNTKMFVREQILEIFGAADALSSSSSPSSADLPQSAQCDDTPSPGRVPPRASEKVSPQEPSHDGDGLSPVEREYQRLKNLTALQERILDMKDAELKDLRSQRDWLQARIERLEEKSERDQLLLLSETQTIRKLVSYQEQRRSPFQNILEWLGIAKQPDLKTLSAPDSFSNSDSVEVKSEAANS